MARFSVKAIFEAIDRITAPVRKMQNNVGKFTRSMEKSLRSVSRLTNRLSKNLLKVGKRIFRFGAFAVTAGLAAATVAITKTANAADALAKRSDRIKFPIEELQQWQFVAEQSGLSTQQFDQSLENFTRVLGQAKLGTGALSSTLKQFNPQLLRQLRSTDDISESFKLLINGIRDTKDETLKMSLAMSAFGRSGGANFINIANQSTDAIDELIKEMIENGIITKELAKNAEDYNDALNTLKRSLTGLTQNVILPLLPKLTEMISKFRELIITNKDLIKTNITNAVKKIKDIIERVVVALKQLNSEQDVLTRLVKVIDVLAKAFIFLSKNLKIIVIVAALISSILVLNVALKAAVIIIGLFNTAILFNPVVLTIALILAMAAALIVVTGGWERLLELLKAIPQAIRGNFSPLREFFSNLWNDIATGFKNDFKPIFDAIDKIGRILPFGTQNQEVVNELFGSSIVPKNGVGPQVVSPNERIARSIEEQRTTNTSEITIKDETRRAEVTSGTLASGITMHPTGGF